MKGSILTALFLLMAAVAGCGGGGGGGIVAGGGIGGTGIGTVTGFGSIIFNGDTELDVISGDTEILLDGEEVSQSDLFEASPPGPRPCTAADTACGLVGSFDARAGFDDDPATGFKRGTADRVELEHQVKGPVTNTDPLEALGQPLVTTAETVFAGGIGSAADLKLGDLVEVSGLVDGAIQVTRLEKKTGLSTWKIIGRVSNIDINALTFDVGNQPIKLFQASACVNGLQDNDLVEVKANPNDFTPTGQLRVFEVECRDEGLRIPPGAAGNIKAEVEGIVNAVTTDTGGMVTSFTVHGQVVRVDAGTIFEGGRLQDIVVGAKVEAEGSLNTSTGDMTAKKVKFDEARVRIEAPHTVATGGLANPFRILGIDVRTTALTEDEDGLMSGVTSGAMQLAVKAFVDGSGAVFATEVKRKSASPDAGNVLLRGPVASIKGNPDYSFEILGVTVVVPATGVVFEPPMNRDAFFSALGDGDAVEVQGSYDGVTTITATEVELED